LSTKYGDVPALLALCAPVQLQLGGEPAVPAPTAASYAAAGGHCALLAGPGDTVAQAVAALSELVKVGSAL
jgi:hypothetical protein